MTDSAQALLAKLTELQGCASSSALRKALGWEREAFTAAEDELFAAKAIIKEGRSLALPEVGFGSLGARMSTSADADAEDAQSAAPATKRGRPKKQQNESDSGTGVPRSQENDEDEVSEAPGEAGASRSSGANVSNIVKSIQDIMRKDAGTYGDAQRIEQIAWMFFLKIFDDREKELELLRDEYTSPLPARLRWSAWASNAEGITGEALLNFINNELLPQLKALAGSSPMHTLLRMTFEDANNYMKNGTLMRQVVNKINGIDFNTSSDRHLFGDIYEKILKDLQSAGNAGEFYTPRAVTEFIVDRVNPRLGESVLDPACGTGGFLTCVIEHLRQQVSTVQEEATLQGSFAGIEKKALPHVLCMTNLLLHGIDVPSNVRHDNTLARPLRDWGPKERVDVIVTNPPFGGMEEDGIEANYPAEFRTRETADLFLVLIMKILKPGGRAGLVLPDGTLFGEGVKTRIKESLLSECNLHTIVRLPNGVFAPYTGIRTNLLFFTKGAPTTEVWYYEHPYPSGAKSYNKTKPIRVEEFAPEQAWWDNRFETEFAWKVSIDEIKKNGYNLDLKNPHRAATESHDLPTLISEYEALLAKIATTRASLRDQLAQALQRSETQG